MENLIIAFTDYIENIVNYLIIQGLIPNNTNQVLQRELSLSNSINFEESVKIIFHKHYKLHIENLVLNGGKSVQGIFIY